jgi:hypothetical protein
MGRAATPQTRDDRRLPGVRSVSTGKSRVRTAGGGTLASTVGRASRTASIPRPTANRDIHNERRLTDGTCLLGDGLHQHRDATLRRRVIGMTRPWNNLVYRADTDDLSRRAGDLWNDAAAQELQKFRRRLFHRDLQLGIGLVRRACYFQGGQNPVASQELVPRSVAPWSPRGRRTENRLDKGRCPKYADASSRGLGSIGFV